MLSFDIIPINSCSCRHLWEFRLSKFKNVHMRSAKVHHISLRILREILINAANLGEPNQIEQHEVMKISDSRNSLDFTLGRRKGCRCLVYFLLQCTAPKSYTYTAKFKFPH